MLHFLSTTKLPRKARGNIIQGKLISSKNNLTRITMGTIRGITSLTGSRQNAGPGSGSGSGCLFLFQFCRSILLYCYFRMTNICPSLIIEKKKIKN